MENIQDTSLTLQKMVFIYNALLMGWTVRMMECDKFEFTKAKSNVKREVNLNDFLVKFIKYNLDIDNIMSET